MYFENRMQAVNDKLTQHNTEMKTLMDEISSLSESNRSLTGKNERLESRNCYMHFNNHRTERKPQKA